MNEHNLLIALDRIKFYARDALVTVTQCICRPDATLKINGRQFKVERLLGEGGFSFVYLIRDTSSGRLFALKKVIIMTGQEGVQAAMREIEAYRRFRHPNIIKLFDSAVVQDESADGKIIYMFLPYYTHGNLQDLMAQVSVTGNRVEEDRLLRMFHGTCLGVRAMHQYRLPAVNATYPPQRDEDPLMPDELVFDAPEDEPGQVGELVPYAHRDIKPGNIMLADDDTPILMDFGSTIKARIEVTTRQQALLEQDIAAEHSTMPYRAPELFDVKTGKTLDEKVDIWSLGCTLFAVAYGFSPFETDGSSLAMAVMSGRYRHPGGYSERLTKLIDAMLVVDPEQRPDIQQVLDLTEAAMRHS
ncbi:uncharacterized protein EHS24_008811 [Apiotrichum porosum]|uniref:non-specific serine/threonine protein kinase n=1 Tax=Apiotrichum porosum TaxID=105984 RepID=A0A427XN65_9TREE|nr:uncharacterized protein EHS24_008811 [Apiotrichum porosum]RSH80238.1 hypothetical protein EHS24_008811 [Apiotrichum porosum]